MGDTLPKFTAAAVQAAPVFLDRDATVDKACDLIEEAGRNGAQLIVLPETWIPGYPFWHTTPNVFSGDTFAELWKNSVEIPSSATNQLGQAAKRAGAYVVIGINERDTYQPRHAVQHAALPRAHRRSDAPASQAHAHVHGAHDMGVRRRQRPRRDGDAARAPRRPDLLGARDDARQVRAVRAGRAGSLRRVAGVLQSEQPHRLRHAPVRIRRRVLRRIGVRRRDAGLDAGAPGWRQDARQRRQRHHRAER